MTDSSKKIMTLHPEEGKSGVNIDKAKYEQVRKAVLEILKNKSPMTPTKLLEETTKKLDGKFEGKIGWYSMSIKLDLEARGAITHDRKTRQITLV